MPCQQRHISPSYLMSLVNIKNIEQTLNTCIYNAMNMTRRLRVGRDISPKEMRRSLTGFFFLCIGRYNLQNDAIREQAGAISCRMVQNR